MPNEIRPCTLWGQTFDAIGASVLPSGRDMGVYTKDNRVIRFEFATREALEISYMEAITTIAEALNAPVEAKDEVLAGLEYKEVIGYCDAGLQHSGVVGNFAGTWKLNRGSWGLMDFGLEDCGIYKVKAKEDDPKTAEYLRQFTLDGVRIKEGG